MRKPAGGNRRKLATTITLTLITPLLLLAVPTPSFATSYDPQSAYQEIQAANENTDAACVQGYTETSTLNKQTSHITYDPNQSALLEQTPQGTELLTPTRQYQPINITPQANSARILAGKALASWLYRAQSNSLTSVAVGDCASYMTHWLLPNDATSGQDGYKITSANKSVTQGASRYFLTVVYNGQKTQGSWIIDLDSQGRIGKTVLAGPSPFIGTLTTVTNYNLPTLAPPQDWQSINLKTFNQALMSPMLNTTVKSYGNKTLTTAKATHKTITVALLQKSASKLVATSKKLTLPVVYKNLKNGVLWYGSNPFTKQTIRYSVTLLHGKVRIVKA